MEANVNPEEAENWEDFKKWQNPEADVIIDEMSMVDLTLMHALCLQLCRDKTDTCRRRRPTSVCGVPGSVLKDIIASHRFPVVTDSYFSSGRRK